RFSVARLLRRPAADGVRVLERLSVAEGGGTGGRRGGPEAEGQARGGRQVRPGSESQPSLAHDTRISGTSDGAGPGDVVGGRLCGNQLPHSGEAGKGAVRLEDGQLLRRPGAAGGASDRGIRRRGSSRPEVVPGEGRSLRGLADHAGP